MCIGFRAISLFALLLLLNVARADLLDKKEPVEDLPQAVAIPVEGDAELSVIDEVTVVEPKSVGRLRFELAKADNRVFSLYNALNSNDSLDMICKKETRIGSQIKYRVCKSSYHRQIESESGSDFLAGGDLSTSARAPAGHYDKVRSNMAKLMAEHPELLQAVHRRAILREKISDQKQKD